MEGNVKKFDVTEAKEVELVPVEEKEEETGKIKDFLKNNLGKIIAVSAAVIGAVGLFAALKSGTDSLYESYGDEEENDEEENDEEENDKEIDNSDEDDGIIELIEF